MNIINKCLLGAVLLYIQPATTMADNNHGYFCGVNNETIRLKAGQIALSFTLDLGKQTVKSQHRRTIIPIIRTDDNSHSVELAPVVVSGRTRALKDRRSGNSYAPTDKPYITLEGKKTRFVEYKANIDRQPWMDKARLILREEVVGCACGGLLDNEQTVGDLLYAPQLALSTEMKCPKEYDIRTKSCDAFLIYPVNKTILLPNRYGNRQELNKIDSVLTAVENNPVYVINRIDIAGYASPEGTLNHNKWLAEGRAQALKSYVSKRYSFANSLLTVTPRGENWDGLKEILSKMEIPYKSSIMEVIKRENDLDKREESIKSIGSGEPYRILLTTVYPMLRKNIFRVEYYSRERTPEEARKMVETHPEELNVYEFYTVADTFYANDKAQRDRTLMIAADSHPTHSIANLNAAIIALQRNDTAKAEKYLQHTANEPFTWNTRACLLWKEGKEEEAVVWWKKAAEANDPKAAMNLEEVRKRNSDI